MDRETREKEVWRLGMLVHGVVGMALHGFADDMLTDAKVHREITDDTVTPHIDVVLSDGWRIRFVRSVIPPEDGW